MQSQFQQPDGAQNPNQMFSMSQSFGELAKNQMTLHDGSFGTQVNQFPNQQNQILYHHQNDPQYYVQPSHFQQPQPQQQSQQSVQANISNQLNNILLASAQSIIQTIQLNAGSTDPQQIQAILQLTQQLSEIQNQLQMNQQNKKQQSVTPMQKPDQQNVDYWASVQQPQPSLHQQPLGQSSDESPIQNIQKFQSAEIPQHNFQNPVLTPQNTFVHPIINRDNIQGDQNLVERKQQLSGHFPQEQIKIQLPKSDSQKENDQNNQLVEHKANDTELVQNKQVTIQRIEGTIMTVKQEHQPSKLQDVNSQLQAIQKMQMQQFDIQSKLSSIMSDHANELQSSITVSQNISMQAQQSNQTASKNGSKSLINSLSNNGTCSKGSLQFIQNANNSSNPNSDPSKFSKTNSDNKEVENNNQQNIPQKAIIKQKDDQENRRLSHLTDQSAQSNTQYAMNSTSMNDIIMDSRNFESNSSFMHGPDQAQMVQNKHYRRKQWLKYKRPSITSAGSVASSAHGQSLQRDLSYFGNEAKKQMEIDDIKCKIKMLAEKLDQLESSEKDHDNKDVKKSSSVEKSGIIGQNKSILAINHQSQVLQEENSSDSEIQSLPQAKLNDINEVIGPSQGGISYREGRRQSVMDHSADKIQQIINEVNQERRQSIQESISYGRRMSIQHIMNKQLKKIVNCSSHQFKNPKDDEAHSSGGNMSVCTFGGGLKSGAGGLFVNTLGQPQSQVQQVEKISDSQQQQNNNNFRLLSGELYTFKQVINNQEAFNQPIDSETEPEKSQQNSNNEDQNQSQQPQVLEQDEKEKQINKSETDQINLEQQIECKLSDKQFYINLFEQQKNEVDQQKQPQESAKSAKSSESLDQSISSISPKAISNENQKQIELKNDEDLDMQKQRAQARQSIKDANKFLIPQLGFEQKLEYQNKSKSDIFSSDLNKALNDNQENNSIDNNEIVKNYQDKGISSNQDQIKKQKALEDKVDVKSVDFLDQKRRIKSIDLGKEVYSIFSFEWQKELDEPPTKQEFNLLNQDIDHISNNQRLNPKKPNLTNQKPKLTDRRATLDPNLDLKNIVDHLQNDLPKFNVQQEDYSEHAQMSNLSALNLKSNISQFFETQNKKQNKQKQTQKRLSVFLQSSNIGHLEDCNSVDSDEINKSASHIIKSTIKTIEMQDSDFLNKSKLPQKYFKSITPERSKSNFSEEHYIFENKSNNQLHQIAQQNPGPNFDYAQSIVASNQNRPSMLKKILKQNNNNLRLTQLCLYQDELSRRQQNKSNCIFSLINEMKIQRNPILFHSVPTNQYYIEINPMNMQTDDNCNKYYFFQVPNNYNIKIEQQLINNNLQISLGWQYMDFQKQFTDENLNISLDLRHYCDRTYNYEDITIIQQVKQFCIEITFDLIVRNAHLIGTQNDQIHDKDIGYQKEIFMHNIKLLIQVQQENSPSDIQNQHIISDCKLNESIQAPSQSEEVNLSQVLREINQSEVCAVEPQKSQIFQMNNLNIASQSQNYNQSSEKVYLSTYSRTDGQKSNIQNTNSINKSNAIPMSIASNLAPISSNESYAMASNDLNKINNNQQHFNQVNLSIEQSNNIIKSQDQQSAISKSAKNRQNDKNNRKNNDKLTESQVINEQDEQKPSGFVQKFMKDHEDPGKVIQFILTKHGSKELQKALSGTKAQNNSNVLVDFLVHKISLAQQFQNILVHQYGNYFCQKLFTNLQLYHKRVLLNDLSMKYVKDAKNAHQNQVNQQINQQEPSKFLWIARDPKGTHSLQVFIENLEESEFKQMLSNLIMCDNPLSFAFNKHGTHVLIKFIELTNEDPFLTPIYHVIADNFSQLSCNVNGLPLVKKCLAWIRTPAIKFKIRQQLIEHAVALSQNPYGNYSLQVAFDNWPIEEIRPIIDILRPELQKLSVQKFSSNVIEKILDLKDKQIHQEYAMELIKQESLKILIKNNFGFFVLDRMVQTCDDSGTLSNLKHTLIQCLSHLQGPQSPQQTSFDQDGQSMQSNLSPHKSAKAAMTTTNQQLKKKQQDLLQKINEKLQKLAVGATMAKGGVRASSKM